MRRLGGLLFALGACSPAPSAPPGATRAAIVGGVDAPEDRAVVVVLVDGEGDCTGSLVAPDVVLTAAHCLVEDVPADAVFSVFTGQDLAQPDAGETVEVPEAVPNPAYDRNDDSGDVAILRLARPLAIVPLPINRAPLAEELVGQPVRMIGYGDTTVAAPTSGFGRRRQATRPLVDVDPDWVVVGDETANQCYGDSGGPALMMLGGVEVIVGVNSWGPHDDCDTFSYNARPDTSLAFLDEHVPPSAPPDDGSSADGRADDAGGDAGTSPAYGEGGCAVSRAATAPPPRSAALLGLIAAVLVASGRRPTGKRARSPRGAARAAEASAT